MPPDIEALDVTVRDALDNIVTLADASFLYCKEVIRYELGCTRERV